MAVCVVVSLKVGCLEKVVPFFQGVNTLVYM